MYCDEYPRPEGPLRGMLPSRPAAGPFPHRPDIWFRFKGVYGFFKSDDPGATLAPDVVGLVKFPPVSRLYGFRMLDNPPFCMAKKEGGLPESINVLI